MSESNNDEHEFVGKKEVVEEIALVAIVDDYSHKETDHGTNHRLGEIIETNNDL